MKRVTIVAAMHGNETYGIDLYNAFILEYPHLKDQVQLIVGNERANKENVRFIDSDLNRHYNDTMYDHESLEMEHIERERVKFSPDYILDIHTTKRSSGVFFISDTLNDCRNRLCAMLPIDVCVMHDSLIKKSFIGHHSNAVSLEYSLDSITNQTTLDFIDALSRLVADQETAVGNSRIFEVKRLISREEWENYSFLKNYDTKPEGTALMVPANHTEMKADYYGFWCTT